jgi:DNA-binding PadR family transcriptional regulator
MDTKTLCLAVLSRGEASGYEIKKALEEPPIGAFQETSFGSIYPALGKLAAEGLVVCRQETQAKRPDKKVYALTEKGKGRLVERLRETPDPDRYRSDFLLVLSLSPLLDRATVKRFIDERIALFEEKLERMGACDLSGADAGTRFVHGFGQALYRAALEYLRAQESGFLEELGPRDAAAE